MKRIVWLFSGVLLLALLYYLVIRQFEFDVNFRVNTTPGDVIETLRIWNKSMDRANLVSVDSFAAVHQTIVWNNVEYLYDWRFKTSNDSVTKVNVRISQPGRSFLNKILIPFSEQTIETDAAEIVGKFYDVVQTHLEITKVKIVGVSTLESKFCACRTLETDQVGKAKGMMRDYPVLTSFIADFQLKPVGQPIVQIEKWSHVRGKIKFDFCFPIQQTDSLPSVKSIFYKELKPGKVLRAEYYGNYITSDRAWYALIDYAQKNGHDLNGFPIEYFHHNPNLGLNEKEWKADIFIPIKN